MFSKKKADSLIRKYKTRNPVEIAKAKGIVVLFENLGTINGYYCKQLRQKQIHINYNLPEHLIRFTAAHELGHAIMHPDENTPFLRSNTYFVIDKLEIEANRFAVELLIPDDEIQEYVRNSYTMEQIARIYGYSKELIGLKELMR